MRILQMAMVAGLSLVGVASAGGQAALSPAILAGQWSGAVVEPAADLHYDMVAQIAPRTDAQGRFAQVRYTNDIGCDVEWFLIGQTARTLSVQERVLDGPCVDVKLELSLDRSGPRPVLRVVSHDDAEGNTLPEITLQAELVRR